MGSSPDRTPLQDFPPSRAYHTPVNARIIPTLAAACLLLAGCHHDTSPSPASAPSEHDQAAAANALFLNQKTFDPWVLKSAATDNPIPFYKSSGDYSFLYGSDGAIIETFQAGDYVSGQLASRPAAPGNQKPQSSGGAHTQTLNFHEGTFATEPDVFLGEIYPKNMRPATDWPRLWQTSDIVIKGDPEAQQVTHANLFYLLSSTYPGSDHSIPPFGLSSNLYGGHIFWDAEAWMLPALIVQHPDYAKSIVDYRFKLLGQARKNAKMHGFAGAEYPWESADTGAEMVGGEFSKERHITADVGWAAWQYYLWTGDKTYLKSEGWPILQATAEYWVSRVTKGADGKYHIKGVLSPDETAGVVDDDAWTNAVVQANLRAAARAAKIMGQSADPRWAAIADGMYFAFDKARGIPAENDTPMTDRFAAKQADTLLLLHPLNVPFDAATQGKMLDFYTAHTIKDGPAMTASIEAVVAARLGRGQDALNLFHDSYRPFMRGPWDAFAEKRTSSRVYFCTGMGGCLQSVLYGFAGLQIVEVGHKGKGTRIAGDGEASLYADPHLPPGWGGLTIKGVKFRGKTFNVAVAAGNKVTAMPR
jgi:trehalose/maltose hydrolase-like predicted phosphorylase